MFSWQKIPQPIFGLAPMDGVTDCVYRSIVWRYGPPDVLFTEFVSAEGLSRHIPVLIDELRFSPEERPMIAQIFGYEPDAFYEAARLVATLGFDGLDINMGCPAKSVVHRGGGAALICAADHAKTIILACRKALDEFFDQTGKRIPLSVKTRLGYTAVTVRDWVGRLLEIEGLSNISLHGRTFKQGYSGEANWDAIGEAVLVAKGSGISILGNGDLQSLDQAVLKIRQTGVNGVLFGRATYGTPWFFYEKEKYRKLVSQEVSFDLHRPSEESAQFKIQTLLEHARLLAEKKPEKYFIQIRKHTGWYLKGFSGASELRQKLCRVTRLEELTELLQF